MKYSLRISSRAARLATLMCIHDIPTLKGLLEGSIRYVVPLQKKRELGCGSCHVTLIQENNYITSLYYTVHHTWRHTITWHDRNDFPFYFRLIFLSYFRLIVRTSQLICICAPDNAIVYERVVKRDVLSCNDLNSFLGPHTAYQGGYGVQLTTTITYDLYRMIPCKIIR